MIITPELVIQLLINGVVIGTGYVLVAMGLNLVFGILDIADFAQGNLYVLAAYLVYTLSETYGFPFWTSAAMAVAIVALVGVGYYFAVYRQILEEPPITTFLAAFGLFSAIQGFIFFYWGPDYRSVTPPYPGAQSVWGIYISNMRLIGLVAAAIVIPATFWFVNRTRLGKSLRAVAQNRNKAILLGIQPHRMYIVTFLLASLLSAVAGVIIAPIFTITPFVGLEAIVKGFIVAIFGGLGSIHGAVVAGYILGSSEALATLFVRAEVANSIGFLVLFLILLFRPQGLFGTEGTH